MSVVIPTIDFQDFTQGSTDRREAFVQTFGQSYQEVGFVKVKNHLLAPELQTSLFDVVRRFFELPDSVKLKYEIVELAGQRGYTSKGREHAKGRNVGDLKEFYHIGQFVSSDDYLQSNYPDNLFPDEELPEFRSITTEVYTKLEETGIVLMRALAVFLGLPESFFELGLYKGNSILRPIHYFPIDNPDELPEGAVRAAEHEDINLITLLMGASADGLEVLSRCGYWVAIPVEPNELVVNCGDMLQRLTNHKLVSTTHRVVNPPRELMHTSRYSAPFFMHPRPEFRLDCLPSCCTAENPPRYPPISANDFLIERLREIGLIK
jgi:isopenicillin N synthase-like dioxygenase